jgi:chemotaxis protein histidine kinase CheA
MTSEQDIDSDLVAELLPFFIDDVVERLGSVEQMLVSFSKSSDAKPDSFELLRNVHSIKGSAASFGFPTIALISHHLEDYIIATGNFSDTAVDGMRSSSADAIRAMRKADASSNPFRIFTPRPLSSGRKARRQCCSSARVTSSCA